ncbi:MORN repeat protein [Rivularia sp. PCC 7116]|uniref:MORN repeat protein n=1 Tax=Rivularia sp. PCC 7116 TaxID=373994 RepID=UPI00029F29B4|nr:MORN repeat protein [Rivularia sp. PCC 7116]AFY56541.1 MORN repeat protein [Rivularia sp. PCC 7116]
MKFVKVLSVGLVAFALFGCNQTSAVSNDDNVIESTEPTISQDQDQDSDSASETTTTKANKPSNSIKIAAAKNNKKNKTGKQIGPRFDCNGDGISNGARIDYDGDGIPDDCIESDEKTKSVIDETSYDTALKSLNSITKGCQESKKTPQATDYYICKLDGKIVKASEYNSEAGAGLDFWFIDNRVIAVQRPHSQELFLYDKNGKLKSKFNYPKKVRNISNQDRKDGEYLYNRDGYERIVSAFNHKSSAKTTTSKNGIIDETSFQTISKSLDSITKGCQKTEKTQNGNNYEICKQGNSIVNASEYNAEVGAGLAYWFSPNGKVVAARYLASGDLYVFNSNGKVTSKIDVYESKKINNISAEDRKQAEQNLYVNYKDIFKVFNL